MGTGAEAVAGGLQAGAGGKGAGPRTPPRGPQISASREGRGVRLSHALSLQGGARGGGRRRLSWRPQGCRRRAGARPVPGRDRLRRGWEEARQGERRPAARQDSTWPPRPGDQAPPWAQLLPCPPPPKGPRSEPRAGRSQSQGGLQPSPFPPAPRPLLCPALAAGLGGSEVQSGAGTAQATLLPPQGPRASLLPCPWPPPPASAPALCPGPSPEAAGLCPLQFVKVPSGVAPSVLFDLLLAEWRLPAPNLVLSLVGVERPFPMRSWLRGVLRKGLVKVAQSTGQATARSRALGCGARPTEPPAEPRPTPGTTRSGSGSQGCGQAAEGPPGPESPPTLRTEAWPGHPRGLAASARCPGGR